MRPEDHPELQELLFEQRRLRLELDRLDRRVERFLQDAAAAASPPVPPPLPRSAPPAPVRVAPVENVLPTLPVKSAPSAKPATPAPVSALPPATPAGTPPPPPPPPAGRESFELQLGAVWLARIGIVILLTGMVFLGNYAWQHLVPHLGPGAKIALLYVASGALAALGAWMYRRQTTLQLYAQVLLAGGAALAYYTTYAAHFVERLRIIESPLVGGAALLACGGALLWVADRRRWQVAAVLTILLSYYTAGINPIGDFTLYSSLLLTAAGLYLFLRHRWIALSWISLAGTFGSYLFWQQYRAVAAAGPAAEPWRLGLFFLTGYWVLFTAAAFHVRRDLLPPPQRIAFLSLNNAAFLLLGAYRFLDGPWHGSLWFFLVAYGAALLALALAARHWRSEEAELDGAYLVQGAAIATIGLGAKFSGPDFVLVLAAESLVLLTGVGRRHGQLFAGMAATAATWAFALVWYGRTEFPPGALPLGGLVAAVLIGDAWWLKRRLGVLTARRWHPLAGYFVLLALLLLSQTLQERCPPDQVRNAFALTAVACTASIYLLGLPEIVFLGQAFLAGSLYPLGQTAGEGSWWLTWPVAASALALAHWWQWQKRMELHRSVRAASELLAASVLVIAAALIVAQHARGDAIYLAWAAAALATLGYGWLTRAWAVAVAGQLFVWLLTAEVLGHALIVIPLTQQAPSSLAAFAPAAVLLASHFLLPAALRRGGVGTGEQRGPWPQVYWVAAFGMLTHWAIRFLPEAWQGLFFAGLFLLLLAAAGLFSHRPSGVTALLFGALVFPTFWLRAGHPRTWMEALSLLLVPAAARGALRWSGAGESPLRAVQPWFAGLAVGSLWLWVTTWCTAHDSARMLTIAWSCFALAVLVTGLVVRERVYRLGGFFILALAIGRIFTIDVWALETIYRILSFLSLGGILLVLGFLYSRYSAQIRRWL